MRLGFGSVALAVALTTGLAGAQEIRVRAPVATDDGSGTVITEELFAPQQLRNLPRLVHPELAPSMIAEPPVPMPLLAHPALPSVLVEQPTRAPDVIVTARRVEAPVPVKPVETVAPEERVVEVAPPVAPPRPPARVAPRKRLAKAAPERRRHPVARPRMRAPAGPTQSASLEAAEAWLQRTVPPPQPPAQIARTPPQPPWPLSLLEVPARIGEGMLAYAPEPPTQAQAFPRTGAETAPIRTQRAVGRRAARPEAAAPLHLVGMRLPATVALHMLPADMAARVPSAWRYRYAVLKDRVLLVDPVSRTVVGDITE